jgi:glycosidase
MAGLTALEQVDWADLRNRPHHPSPAAWEDQVFYFLLVDRFSDGREDGYRDAHGQVVAGTTPPLTAADRGNAVTTPGDADRWRSAGAGWVGGTLGGITSKIGYLARLGVTAIWVSPVLRQVEGSGSYHGYGTQNFLEVDPHFGTTQDLRTLVQVAHAHGIYVVLDVIFNHTGDVFAYDPDRYWTPDGHGGQFLDPRWDGNPYRIAGFRDQNGDPTIPFAPVDPAAPPPPAAAVWPAEIFHPATFTAKGRISNWDDDPEFREGDFFSLKDVRLGGGSTDDYRPSPALVALTRAYQYWIGRADVDGFRVDTVKHMDLGAARYIAAVLHEYAMSLGKENFYLIGEITGGRRRAYETLEETGLDAALGIDDIPDKLEYVVKGWRDPSEYFDLFRNSLQVHKDSHVWFRDKVVTVYDDHDQVRKGEHKARFCADAEGPGLALAVLALSVATLGIRSSTTAASRPSTAPVTTTATSARPCSAASSVPSPAAAGTSSTKVTRSTGRSPRSSRCAAGPSSSACDAAGSTCDRSPVTASTSVCPAGSPDACSPSSRGHGSSWTPRPSVRSTRTRPRPARRGSPWMRGSTGPVTG